jgi:hypothetical protein
MVLSFQSKFAGSSLPLVIIVNGLRRGNNCPILAIKIAEKRQVPVNNPLATFVTPQLTVTKLLYFEERRLERR